MVIRSMSGLVVAALWIGSAAAEGAPPSYQADPSTYKVIFEDQNFRVIEAIWKKGATDKPHSHSLPFVTYALDDCTVRIHNPDGTSRDLKNQTGVANTFENTAIEIDGVLYIDRMTDSKKLVFEDEYVKHLTTQEAADDDVLV